MLKNYQWVADMVRTFKEPSSKAYALSINCEETTQSVPNLVVKSAVFGARDV